MMRCRCYSWFFVGCILGMGLAIATGSATHAAPHHRDAAHPTSPAPQGWLAQRWGNNQFDFFEQGQAQLDQEINRLQQQSPDPVLTVNATPQHWQAITSNAGNYSIWMAPGTLTAETKILDTAIGQLTFQVMASNSSRARTVVAYTDLPPRAISTSFDQTLTAVGDRLKSHATYPLANEQTVSLLAYPGRELTFKGNNQETVIIRYYLVQRRLYLIGARYQDDALNNLAPVFLSSFQLLN